MGDVVKSIEAVTNLIAEASDIPRQQSVELHEIAETLGSLDEAVQQNAALVEEEAAAAQRLSSQSQKLHALVAEFKLPEGFATANVQPILLPSAAKHAPKVSRPKNQLPQAPARKLSSGCKAPQLTNTQKPA
jgi:methyl-accepting chemotaxis protein